MRWHRQSQMRGVHGEATRAILPICRQGGMFYNDSWLNPRIWNDILSAMIDVRNVHGCSSWTCRADRDDV